MCYQRLSERGDSLVAAKKTLINQNVKTERINYGKVKSVLPLPNLISVQTDSYKWFIEKVIREVFEDIYPIESSNEQLR